MIWWYRNVFIDRSLPLNGPESNEWKRVSQKTENSLWHSAGNLLKAMKQKFNESLRSHYDWKVYKNLSDHQLKDIGLTRDGLHLLLHGKMPVIPQQRIKTVKKPRPVSSQEQLITEKYFEKPVVIPRNINCSNDCEEKVA